MSKFTPTIAQDQEANTLHPLVAAESSNLHAIPAAWYPPDPSHPLPSTSVENVELSGRSGCYPSSLNPSTSAPKPVPQLQKLTVVPLDSVASALAPMSTGAAPTYNVSQAPAINFVSYKRRLSGD